jgi:chromosome segregation ATPase
MIDWNTVIEKLLSGLIAILPGLLMLLLVYRKLNSVERPVALAQVAESETAAAKNAVETMERLQKQQENENLGQRNILLRLQNELLEKQTSHERVISALKIDLQAKLDQRDTERNAAAARAAEAESQIVVLQEKTQALEENGKSDAEKIAQLEKDRIASNNKIMRLEQELNAAREELATVQEERKVEQGQMRALESKVGTLTEQLEAERTRNQQLVERLADVEQVQTTSAEAKKDDSSPAREVTAPFSALITPEEPKP